MPKLSTKARKTVSKADAIGDGSFEPMPPGKYIATLTEVVAKVSANGNAMWVAEFNNIVSLDGEKQPGRLWYQLMLPVDKMPDSYNKGEEKWAAYQSMTAGRLKGFFEAFGYSEDSDTDEMISEQAVLTVGVETITAGNRKGELTNRVNGIAALDTVDAVADSDDDDEDGF